MVGGDARPDARGGRPSCPPRQTSSGDLLMNLNELFLLEQSRCADLWPRSHKGSTCPVPTFPRPSCCSEGPDTHVPGSPNWRAFS